ncbi:MAG: endonuclease domain-containing protein [Rhodanobacteraceae bacterium]
MKGQTNRSILAPKLQRRLRNRPTDAERLLWQRLRLRQLDGCKFRRQHPFRDYILDFVCPERKLIVELDGSQHAANLDADATRTALLEQAGFVVLRFWNNQVFQDTDGVCEAIRQSLGACDRHHPLPTLPLKGREKSSGPSLEGEGAKRWPSP